MGGLRRIFCPTQQLRANPLSAALRGNFDRLQVSLDSTKGLAPLHNGKSCHLSVSPFRNPGRRICVLYKLPHVPSSKPERRLKATLLDRIERGKIFRLIETIEHIMTLFRAGKRRQPGLLALGEFALILGEFAFCLAFRTA